MASFTVPILRSGTLRGIAQAPPRSVPTPKVKYRVHDRSTAFHLYAKEQPLLIVDSCISCVQTEVVLSYSYRRKVVQCLETSFCSQNLYFTLSSSNGYSSSLIAVCLYAYCVHVNELRRALSCWDLLVSIQGWNRLASVVGSVRACTGTEGAASSKFRRVNIIDRLKILDTILIYLFLTSFLPMHSMHCPTPCTRHASPTVPPAKPMRVSRMH